MAKNENLHAAKVNANDEFYTQYSDIANELGHYREHFRGKTVYCNCDDPTWSNFWRFFHNNFASLGLKKLISTHYQKDTEPSYALIYEGGDDFNMDAGRIVEIHGNYAEVNGKQVFYTAGDFRSDACIELLEEADICVTNPPWSLFREYIAKLIEYRKAFIVLGNKNAITYKEIFPLLKDDRVWLGYGGASNFLTPNGQTKKVNGLARWYTNLDISKRHDGLWHRAGKFDQTQAHKYYEGNENKYLKYDNYDAINVNKTADIPIDYAGVMGVPITWLDEYNPEEFEIIGFAGGWNGDSMLVIRKYPKKQVQHNKDGSITAVGKMNDGTPQIRCSVCPNDNTYYTVGDGGFYIRKYGRILVRNRNPIAKKDDLGY